MRLILTMNCLESAGRLRGTPARGRGHVSHHVRGESLRYKKDMGQKTAVSQAGEILGVKEIRQIGFPDQRLDTVTLTEIITPLEKISDEFKPNIVYCQYGGDINMDHQLLFQAANVAFRPLDGWIEDVYAFYTASSTEWGFPRTFTPDTWIDITDTLEKKIEAFLSYHSEVRAYPHPRSAKALEHAAHFWGTSAPWKRLRRL